MVFYTATDQCRDERWNGTRGKVFMFHDSTTHALVEAKICMYNGESRTIPFGECVQEGPRRE